ncbi:hypothetical protein EYF80_039154 [Liparis tanakae]|uniref:Uncharacterized protein n=1 Tax=Liparis tanakae TaxID=230148 RepID=A0A4Z2GBQ2_9TELE|nr:hypothetical protein EYF80_039154 [Liparis tanakae]
MLTLHGRHRLRLGIRPLWGQRVKLDLGATLLRDMRTRFQFAHIKAVGPLRHGRPLQFTDRPAGGSRSKEMLLGGRRLVFRCRPAGGALCIEVQVVD